MIDPKFNEIEDTTEAGLKKPGVSAETTSTPAQPRRGLSINDTIASDANLSVGSRGTDTSGVRAGAGAGAGSTYLTPGSAGESPAPSIIPGGRGSGTTALGGINPDQAPTVQDDLTDQPESDLGKASASSQASPVTSTILSEETYVIGEDTYDLNHEEISAHAYTCWRERGSPVGSPQEDWDRAIQELRARKRGLSSSATA